MIAMTHHTKTDHPATCLAAETGRPETNQQEETRMSIDCQFDTLPPVRPTVDFAWRAASEQASLFGAAMRAMLSAPESAYITGQQLAAMRSRYEAAMAVYDKLFRHATWCSHPENGAHNCVASAADYVDGVARTVGDPVPRVSAVAWANEEDGVPSVCLHLVPDEGEDDGSEAWFSADQARQLAAQLIGAADLVDGGVR